MPALQNPDSKSDLIPITLLTGFLGSGKTTVLNHLVRQPEMADTLVIINEFGEVGLDHMLVSHSSEGQVVEMSSGCLCCTIRVDLMTTLRDITWRFSIKGKRLFQRVLIETTGLADPVPIIHTLMTNPQITSKYRFDGVVANVDMATGMHSLDQHREALRQAAVADVLLLTKPDLADNETRAALMQRLDRLNPAAARFDVRNGEIAPRHLLNLGLFALNNKVPDVADWLANDAGLTDAPHEHAGHSHGADSHGHSHHAEDGHAHHHDVNRHNDQIQAYCYSFDKPIADEVFGNWIETLKELVGTDILRIKGILNVAGEERPIVVHGVQNVFHPPAYLPEWPDDDRRSHLVFITQDVGREVIEKAVRVLQPMVSPNAP